MKTFVSMTILATALVCAGGCGGTSTSPATDTTAPRQEAISRIGDVTIRANAMATTSLTPEVASQYGIARSEGTVMLLVGVRQGAEAEETALPAQITATAINLSGQRQDIVLRELRSGDLLDYVGTVEVTPPETLRFDLKIVREGGATSTMQFSREFYPQ